MTRLALQSLVVAAVATLVAACTPGIESSEEGVGGNESSLTKEASWQLPDDVAAIGAQASIEYDDVPGDGSCADEMPPGSKVLSAFLKDNFEGISTIGGLACRPNTANTSKMSVHSTGRALDIMIPTVNGGPDTDHGNAIADWLVTNASTIGIQLVIWNHSIWHCDGRNVTKYGGPIPHIDHVHAELNNAAANEQTPFFTSDSKPTIPSTTPDTTTTTPAPTDPFVPQPLPLPQPQPLPVTPTQPTTPPAATDPTKKTTKPPPSNELGDGPGETDATQPVVKGDTKPKDAAKDDSGNGKPKFHGSAATEKNSGCSTAGGSSSNEAAGAVLLVLGVALARRRQKRN